MFDDIFELLDSPRQALTNVARSVFGDADPLGGLPGGLGLLGTLALGATGVGLPLALLGGSAIGGLAQSGGNASGNEAFRAPTAGEVAKGMFGSDDFLPSLLAGALTDPLTYVGGIGGARAGGQLGKGIEQATHAAGPGYNGSAALLEAIQKADRGVQTPIGMSHVGAHGGIWGGLPDEQFARLASEIPPGSQYLGHGAEGVALKTPSGDVIRAGPVVDQVGVGRPIDPTVNPSFRTVDVPVGESAFRIERSPLAEVKENDFWYGREGPGGEMRIKQLAEDAKTRGLGFTDMHAGNVGVVGGLPVVIDPGSLMPMSSFSGGFSPVTLATPEASRIHPLADRLLKPRDRLRQILESGRPADDLGIESLLTRLGGLAGTGSVVGERSF